jgi:Tol biopolymer transport system component
MSSYDNQIGIMGFQTGVNISPNGKQIVISAKNYDEGVIINNWPACQIWTTSIKGENLVQITKPPEPYTDFSPCWSPDGKSIAFVRSKLIKDPKVYGETSIYTVNSSGGEPKLLMTEPDVICSIKWSPDGKYIAYLNNNGLNIIEAQNGISRIVGKVPRWTVHTELAWSPDSKRIAFNDPGSKAVKVISVEDGHIQDIETGLIDINIFHLDWSPDGKRFVFVGYMGGEPEFWFLENFLPLEKLVQKKEKENLKESKGIKIRQVWTGSGVDNTGNVSADGKYLSFTNWETGNLMIRNLTTSENRQLTNDATWDKPQQYAESSLISPDGKQVAYLWYYDRGDKGYYELRLIQVGNQTTTNLYSCSKNEYVMPKLWTSDNKKIIFQNYVSNNIWQLSSIDVTSREVRLLKEKTKPLWIPNLSLSPDDKYLAFDFPNPSDKGNYDIYLMSIDSKNELPIVEHPANDRLLGWLPGRNELLFFSDRSGKWDLWAIPVDNGKPSGLVKRIYADIGEADPMGLTHTGDCYLGISRSNYNTYIVPFNVETGVVKEESGKSLAGSNTWVKWSPDGQYLTYIKDNKKTNYPWQLTIQDIKTGEERKVANNLLTARSLCWSPEGNSILAVGHDKTKFSTKGYKGGIYKTDIRTGLTTEILNISDYKYNAPEDETYPLSNVEWSSDGKSIFYLFFTDRLVKRNLETGEDKILYKNSRFVRNILQRSPDGKDLLFGVFSPEEKKSRLFTIPVDGGKEKELCTSQEAISFNSANWSPDGKCIYFLDSDGNNFWRVSAEGGMPQKVWYSKSKIRSFDINPNETQIVLVKPEQITEIRVIENLVQELEKVDNQNEK